MPPPLFVRSVNPISTRGGGTLSPPSITCPPGFSDLAMALECDRTRIVQPLTVNSSDFLFGIGVYVHILSVPDVSCYDRFCTSCVWAHIELEWATTVTWDNHDVIHHWGGIGLSFTCFGYAYHFLHGGVWWLVWWGLWVILSFFVPTMS